VVQQTKPEHKAEGNPGAPAAEKEETKKMPPGYMYKTSDLEQEATTTFLLGDD
jgi:hypothetical protein